MSLPDLRALLALLSDAGVDRDSEQDRADIAALRSLPDP
jgi:hypothetical protein